MGDFRGTVRHGLIGALCLIFSKTIDAPTQWHETIVNVAGLFQPVTLGVRPFLLFGPGQIDQMEEGGGAGQVGLLVGEVRSGIYVDGHSHNVNSENRVRSGNRV